MLQKHKVIFTQNIIEQQNWNELWEKNFEPVWVDDFVGIRAAFHRTNNQCSSTKLLLPQK